MNLKKLSDIRVEAKSARTLQDLQDAVLQLVDALVEHEKENEVEFEKLEKEVDKNDALNSGKK